jgi:hypothetical protein
MAFTMACPNFKKGLKMVSGPLGVKCLKNNPDKYLKLAAFIIFMLEWEPMCKD